MTDKLCSHCGMEIAIRNPSGYCDHLYYPNECEICSTQSEAQQGHEDQVHSLNRQIARIMGERDQARKDLEEVRVDRGMGKAYFIQKERALAAEKLAEDLREALGTAHRRAADFEQQVRELWDKAIGMVEWTCCDKHVVLHGDPKLEMLEDRVIVKCGLVEEITARMRNLRGAPPSPSSPKDRAREAVIEAARTPCHCFEGDWKVHGGTCNVGMALAALDALEAGKEKP